jgi:predicted aspartyl protease
MGLTVVEGSVRGPAGAAAVRFLVDSGATYTLVPYDTWQAIGLIPKRTMS